MQRAAYRGEPHETGSAISSTRPCVERNHAALLSSYLPRFQKVLPARKVARLYQVENKIRALVNYDLASEIPFVK